MVFKDQLSEVLTACIIDKDYKAAESLLAHAPVKEVRHFAELIHRICVNPRGAQGGQN
jgi:hypothetical protein